MAQQGLSYAAVARQVGLCRVTVKRWLLLDLPSDRPLNSGEMELSSNPSSQAEEASDRQGSMPEARSTAHFEHNSPDDKSRATQLPPPPAPWTGWDQVAPDLVGGQRSAPRISLPVASTPRAFGRRSGSPGQFPCQLPSAASPSGAILSIGLVQPLEGCAGAAARAARSAFTLRSVA